MTSPHLSVLKEVVLEYLNLKPGDTVIDCTVGAGGHAAGMLEKIGPAGKLLGLDMDPLALQIARTRLSPYQAHIRLVEANFEQAAGIAAQTGFSPANAILADLGVSSMQLDTPERGFSFLQDGPLDMRLGPQAGQSAAELVNTLAEKDLADIIYRYGEERKSRVIARAIVNNRPVHTTAQLAQIVSRAAGGRGGQKIHPATRTFQAIRIAVNDELGVLERFLPAAMGLLAPEGRLAVISFHSLEDRLVKHFFQQEATDCLCPPRQPVCVCGHKAGLTIITPKPLTAGEAEIEANPRARSAKLRVAERKRIL